MLTRLRALTRPLDLAGPPALGIAIYADHHGEPFGARESGEEGVTCIDDVARALVLWCDLWELTRLPVARAWVDGLLGFCRWMQQPDGRFLNFVLDWGGARNAEGITSRADGASFWHARGARAMAKVWRTFGDERAHADLERAIASFDDRPAGSDVRAIQILAALDGGGHETAVSRWCDDIVRMRKDELILDAHDAIEPHLWGHIQEGVLAEAGVALGRKDLVDVAARSADRYLGPLIAGGFALPTVQPYGVASAAYVMDRLYAATGATHYRDAARDAREWFDGRNPGRYAVYDRSAGRVADGLDHDRPNPHSGAESNILGAQALVAEVAAWLMRHPDACFPLAQPSRTPDVSSAVS